MLVQRCSRLLVRVSNPNYNLECRLEDKDVESFAQFSKLNKKQLLKLLGSFYHIINYNNNPDNNNNNPHLIPNLLASGVLEDVKKTFDIGDDRAGLLQTVFVIAYMVFAPMFGYLGDRYSRRYIMACGVALWCITTFLGSFLQVKISSY